jgi:hypothetical protein
MVQRLERLVVAQGQLGEAHARDDPLGIELQSVEEARLGLLGTSQVQESPARGLYHLGVVRLEGQRLLEARERILQKALPRERFPLF